ncbi:Cytochrome c-552 [bacterium HR11]|nr:Cytochrome c-552 [bacterium HR11]
MSRSWTLLLLVLGSLSVGTWTARPQEAASSEFSSEGHRLFTQACAPCHQPSGRGVTGVYPPLTPHVGRYVQVPEGREYVIRVVLFGLMGRMESESRTYDNIMLPIGLSLTDQQVADILNFVLRELNLESLPKDFKDIRPDEVAQQRKRQRGLGDGLKERDLVLKKLKELEEKEKGGKR